jgi:hypothetical protein
MYNVIKILVINYLQKSLISTYSMHDILSSKQTDEQDKIYYR